MQLTHEWMRRLAGPLKCRPEDFISDFKYEQRPAVGKGFADSRNPSYAANVSEEVEQLLILYNRSSPAARAMFDMVAHGDTHAVEVQKKRGSENGV